MSEGIDTVFELLKEDAELAKLLADHMDHPGRPAIYDVYIPKDAAMPYLRTSYIQALDETQSAFEESMTITFDVLSDKKSTVEADRIRRRVQQILNFSYVRKSDNTIRLYYMQNDAIVEGQGGGVTGDPAIIQWSFDFLVKYFRNDLLFEGGF